MKFIQGVHGTTSVVELTRQNLESLLRRLDSTESPTLLDAEESILVRAVENA